MQMDRFTLKAQAALQEAHQIADRYAHQEVDCIHLLRALSGQTDSLVPSLLQKVGVSLPNLVTDIENDLSRRIKVKGTNAVEHYLSTPLRKALEDAEKEAAKLHDETSTRESVSS